ncbi:MAG: hypothetical protein ACQKBY_04305 [Verrucomicrobiales bacterium]
MSLSTILVLVAGVTLLVTAGVFYVVVKNKQVQTQREIARVEKLIHEHEVAITSHRADIEEQLGIYRLRKRLGEAGSALVSLPYGKVETCSRSGRREEPRVVSRE